MICYLLYIFYFLDILEGFLSPTALIVGIVSFMVFLIIASSIIACCCCRRKDTKSSRDRAVPNLWMAEYNGVPCARDLHSHSSSSDNIHPGSDSPSNYYSRSRDSDIFNMCRNENLNNIKNGNFTDDIREQCDHGIMRSSSWVGIPCEDMSRGHRAQIRLPRYDLVDIGTRYANRYNDRQYKSHYRGK